MPGAPLLGANVEVERTSRGFMREVRSNDGFGHIGG